MEQFQSVFTRNSNISLPPVNLRTTIPTIPHLNIEKKGVLKLLTNLKTSKAMGPDSTPNIVLKTCAEELAQGLRDVFQFSLDTGTLPQDWRNANISPVFKKGDRHLPENYRPVSLTSVPCKILEHIICSHM